MSLKAFHVFFVFLSTVLGVVCGLWAIREYQQSQATGHLVFACSSFVAALAMIVYGGWMLRKLKNISYI